MSKSGSIKSLIMELLNDGKTHTVDEIRSEAYKQNLAEEGEKDVALINSAIFLLRKKNLITCESRGNYRLQTSEEKSAAENTAKPASGKKRAKYSEEANSLLQRAEELKNFDWLNCTSNELEKARKDAALLKDLSVKLSAIFSKK